MEILDLAIDVTEAAGLGETAAIAVTVHLPSPEAIGPRPVVCFAKPGGGFSRRYFTDDLPGPGSGAQAEWHADRGWVFVSVDHLGVGDSSTHHDPARLDYAVVSAASHAAELVVLERLANGALHESLPPLVEPTVLGIGQSMGGCLTVVQQGRYHCYHGIGVLGFSAVHTQPPTPPGEAPAVAAWRLRDGRPSEPPVILNQPQGRPARPTDASPDFFPAASPRLRWLFYYDDVDSPSFLGEDEVPRWASTTAPWGVLDTVGTPGVIAPEAAAVTSPVLVAVGERDVIADPKGEPRAYLSATSVDLFVCPRMAHMHNFASTRQLLWHRIETWGSWVAQYVCAHPPPARA